MHGRRLLGLVYAYVGLTFAGTWACWGLSALLGQVAAPGPSAPADGGFGLAGLLGTLAGALQVMGTLAPAVAVYALFPCVRALGLAGEAGDGDDPRAGFWAFAFGARPRPGGWLFFVALAAWRWAMFRVALGFPETPGAALGHFVATLPALLLGGGLEEIGWRGLLQPALARLLEGRGAGRGRRVGAALLAPLVVGVIWAFWHLPLFSMAGTYQHGLAFLPFAGIAVALSYALGALRALTGGPLASILGHAWYNAMLVAPLTPLMADAAGGPLAGQAALFGALFAAEALVCAAILAVRAGWSTKVST